MERKLYRDEYHKKIAGVCAGLAEYFNVDVAIVRILFVLALIFHGGGGLVYIIFWIALPKRPFIYNPTVDYTVPPQTPGQGSSPFGNSAFPNQPFPNQPYPKPTNNTSLIGIIFGIILIIVGASILLDDFDIIPDWDFGRLWPVILVAVGAVLIFSGEQKKPWEKADWQKTSTDTTAENIAGDKPADNTPPAENPIV